MKEGPFPEGPRVRLEAEGATLLSSLPVARGFWERGLGLMGRRRPSDSPRVGLLFPRCRGLHTCFMRFPLDVFFLDAEGQVVAVTRNLRPWRLLLGPVEARHVLETMAGALADDIPIREWCWLPEVPFSS